MKRGPFNEWLERAKISQNRRYKLSMVGTGGEIASGLKHHCHGESPFGDSAIGTSIWLII